MPSVQQQPRIHIDLALRSPSLELELEKSFPQLCTFTHAAHDADEARVLSHVVEAGGDVFLTQDPSYIFAGKSSDVTALIILGAIGNIPFSRLPLGEKARVLVQLLEQKREEILGIHVHKERSVSSLAWVAQLGGAAKSPVWKIRPSSEEEENRALKRYIQRHERANQ